MKSSLPIFLLLHLQQLKLARLRDRVEQRLNDLHIAQAGGVM